MAPRMILIWASSYGKFMLANGAWVVLWSGVVLGSLWMWWLHVGERRRRARFATRPILDDAAWFEIQFSCEVAHRDLMRAILRAFAEDIGIHWTQLHASDSFDDLYLKAKYVPLDDLGVGWATLEEEIAPQFGFECKHITSPRNTLGELIQSCIAARERNPSAAA